MNLAYLLYMAWATLRDKDAIVVEGAPDAAAELRGVVRGAGGEAGGHGALIAAGCVNAPEDA
ncbi:hypothetical protein ACGFZL_01720 [Streptomyces sp. NPDC048182]|uniref:hypothetical protein n=1 Tax=Streptomyces sp. NPDC048182 TaxID=3365507 RepID=UPI00371AD3DD